MNDLAKDTIETYNKSATEFASHFQQYVDGVARKEIEEAFKLAANPSSPKIVEIGCGAGKDAYELIKRAGWYEGFDPSEKLLEIAREHVPGASFVQADAISYEFPDGLDMVFAFASLLHVGKDDFATVCNKVAQALKPGGIFCMTLKEADEYQEALQEDEFGRRQFYLYNPTLVMDLAGPAFAMAYEDHQVVGPKQKRWFSIILKKVA